MEKTKSICFVTTGDIKSISTAKRALGMANPLANRGWKVSIIMEDTEENRIRVALECNDKVRLYFFKTTSVLKEIREKNRIIQQIRPDYLYICAFVTRNIIALGSSYKKIVEHSELQSGIPDMKGMHKLRVLFNEFFSIFYADYLLNASKYLQNCYLRRCRKIGQCKLPNFYFPYAYSKEVLNPINIDYKNDRFKPYQGKTIFVFLGTVTRNYGVFTILEAVEKLKSKYKDFKVLIFGRGRHYEEAISYIKTHHLSDYVEMPGYIREEDISAYFSLADCFISPMNDTVQDWARCPSKLYMYLPFEKPVITCKIGEPYEVLKETGLYYSPGNSAEMSQQMEHVIMKDFKFIPVDASLHSWNYRTQEFVNWINQHQ
ncbi:glycosyltransferase family 4 protein [Bacteroides ndongoniae]|uniref:glycosyltransferase family 4 protein n=1 Tax=Bacteroides ndongoniae TaxID=1903262 RepID=UPI0008DA26D6|nr:glycosyltransferase family 4 protein [Bacteroides ndongoniae]